MQSQLTIRFEKVWIQLTEKIRADLAQACQGMVKQCRYKSRILSFFQFNNRTSQLLSKANSNYCVILTQDLKWLSTWVLKKSSDMKTIYDFQFQLKVSANKKGQVLGLCSGLQDAFTFQGDKNICFSCYATKQRMNHHLCLAFGKKIFPIHGCQLTVHIESR